MCITLTLPVAPLLTVALIVVALVTLKEAAATPPKVTAVAPVKLFPVMITTVLAHPLPGEKELMVGAGIKVKAPGLVAVPPGVVTVMAPVVPLPTAAVMQVALATVKADAALPPNFTTLAPLKPLPLMVTTVPAPPPLGVNEVMVGAGMKVKVPALLAVPPGVVTLIVPVAPLPTVPLMVVALVTLKEAARRDRRRLPRSRR